MVLAHRRFGKTFYCVTECVDRCLSGSKKTRVFYLAPQLKQAKRVAWSYACDLARMTSGKINKSELAIEWPNGSRMELLGADNPDALRGARADLIVFDETAQIPSVLWIEIVRPMLADFGDGEAIFIGTPKGRQNLLFDLWETAGIDEFDEWERFSFQASETGIIAPKELQSLARSMPGEEYQQELENSFAAVQVGAYYGRLMSDAENENRITRVPYDPSYDAHASADLGYNDATVIWYFQIVGREIRFLDCEAFQGYSLPDIVKAMREKLYAPRTLIVPHDVMQHELGTGRTRMDVLHDMGVQAEVAPRWTIDEGIDAVRNTLPRCVFDRDNCSVGIEAMAMYHSEWDDVRRVYKPRPVHDWSSDYADSFRYAAIGIPALLGYQISTKGAGFVKGII